MVKSWAMLALATSAVFSKTRAACVDIDQYLDIPSPMTGDMEIDLDGVDMIDCDEVPEGYLETVTVAGGTLTLKSSSTVRFVDMGFEVETGANLVFDMPKTKFGPIDDGERRSEYGGHAVRVKEGASATFLGQVLAKGTDNLSGLFRNAGTMEFKKLVVFQGNGNVWRGNTGVVNFRGDATFKDNFFLALSSEESAYVSFWKDATFDNNAVSFDGAHGCGVENWDTSTTIFRGDATFRNNNCDEGSAVYNEGDMTFDGKAYFNNNKSGYESGGATNRGGTMAYNEDVQFNNNNSDFFGGGIFVYGGEVIFSKAVTFDGNTAESGSAFAVSGGTLTFKKPEAVISRNAVLNGYSDEPESCTFGYVYDEGTVIGFTGDDVCVPADNAA